MSEPFWNVLVGHLNIFFPAAYQWYSLSLALIFFPFFVLGP